ncbi:hypothetical protein HYN43_008180 [Mucilaginibacter celer]|uniref:Uncharacterized protein n=1 Tax=Mucilaginibacter celer TaxID=2305508 RepID=A0A494VWB3_9SPHI|nr:hypothetical protein HYN43_008180 [Mucilaginibacter celer]
MAVVPVIHDGPAKIFYEGRPLPRGQIIFRRRIVSAGRAETFFIPDDVSPIILVYFEQFMATLVGALPVYHTLCVGNYSQIHRIALQRFDFLSETL